MNEKKHARENTDRRTDEAENEFVKQKIRPLKLSSQRRTKIEEE